MHDERLEAIAARILVVLLALGVLGALVHTPALGLELVWWGGGLSLPLLVVLLPGIWRNLCPLASLAEAAGRVADSPEDRPPAPTLLFLPVSGVLLAALLAARPLYLEGAPRALFLTLVSLGLMAAWAGSRYPGKSGWCGSLCPGFALERLLGSMPLCPVPNTRCATCCECLDPCPETGRLPPEPTAELLEDLLAGILPGLLLACGAGPRGLVGAGFELGPGALLLLGSAGGLLAFQVSRFLVFRERRDLQHRAFAFLALWGYYGTLLPRLIGPEGPLSDPELLALLPASVWFPWALRAGVGLLLGAWFLSRRQKRRVWSTTRELPRARAVRPLQV